MRLRLKEGEREPAYVPIYREDGRIGPGSNEKPDNPTLSLLKTKLRAQGRQLSAEEIEALREQVDNSLKPKKKKSKS